MSLGVGSYVEILAYSRTPAPAYFLQSSRTCYLLPSSSARFHVQGGELLRVNKCRYASIPDRNCDTW